MAHRLKARDTINSRRMQGYQKPEEHMSSVLRTLPMSSSGSFVLTSIRNLQPTKALFHRNTDRVTLGPKEERWGSSIY